MLNDVLIALVVSTSFGIGAALYIWTKEEFGWLKKLQFPRYFALAGAGILGFVQAVATKTSQLELASLSLFVIGLLFGSFAIFNRDKKLAAKYSAETIVIFLAFFAVVYALLNFS